MNPSLEDLFDELKTAIDEACRSQDLAIVDATAFARNMTGGVSPHGYDLLMDYEYSEGLGQVQLRMVGSTPRRFEGTPFQTTPPPNAPYTYEFELRLRGRTSRDDYANSYQAGAPERSEDGEWITPAVAS